MDKHFFDLSLLLSKSTTAFTSKNVNTYGHIKVPLSHKTLSTFLSTTHLLSSIPPPNTFNPTTKMDFHNIHTHIHLDNVHSHSSSWSSITFLFFFFANQQTMYIVYVLSYSSYVCMFHSLFWLDRDIGRLIGKT